jgi:hypothetical protein
VATGVVITSLLAFLVINGGREKVDKPANAAAELAVATQAMADTNFMVEIIIMYDDAR